MVTGFDVIGVVLAIFPVFTQVIGLYRDKLSGSELKLLNTSLMVDQAIFTNAVYELLSPILSNKELVQLRNETAASILNDTEKGEKLTAYLGIRSDELFQVARDIQRALEKYRNLLPGPVEGISGSTFPSRVKKVIRTFLKAPEQKATLQRLSVLVNHFRTLSEQGLRLASTRRAASGNPLRKLRLCQERARALYEAMRLGWSCECTHSHLTRLQLEIWRVAPGDDIDLDHPRFRFLFSLAPASEDGSRLGKWKYAEIVPLAGDAELDADRKPTSDESSSSFHQNPAQVTFSLPDNSRRRSLGADADEGHLVGDLCNFLEHISDTPKSEGPCLGHLLDSKGQKFGIYQATEQSALASSQTTSVHLSELHSWHPGTEHDAPEPGRAFGGVTPAERVDLARTLGWSVLQLHPTHWLERYWTPENIFLVVGESNSLCPYVTHEFQSNATDGLTLTQSAKESLEQFAQNQALFTLGITLIELCWGRSISDLAVEQDKGSDFLTAMRVYKQVESHLGIKYGRAVYQCLYAPFSDDCPEPSLENEKFQLRVYENIIGPLEEAAQIYRKAS